MAGNSPGRRHDEPERVREAGRRDLRDARGLGDRAGQDADRPESLFISQHESLKMRIVAVFDVLFGNAATKFSEAARIHQEDDRKLDEAVTRQQETAAIAAGSGSAVRLGLRRGALWFMIVFAGVFDFAGGLEVMKRFPSPGLLSADAFRLLGALGISLFIMVPASFAGRELHDALMALPAATAEGRRSAPRGPRRFTIAAFWLLVGAAMVLVIAVARATGNPKPAGLEMTPNAVDAVSTLRWELLLGIGMVTIGGGVIAKFILARDDVYWEAHRDHLFARVVLDGVRGIGGVRRRHAESERQLSTAVTAWGTLRAGEATSLRAAGTRYRSLHDAFTAGVRITVPDYPVLVPAGIAVVPRPADDLTGAERRGVRSLEAEAARRLLAVDPLALVIPPRDMPSDMARVCAALRGEGVAAHGGRANPRIDGS